MAVPVERRIARSGGLIGRRRGLQRQGTAGRGRHLGGTIRPVAAHPDAVAGARQIGDHKTALVVGHHDADEFGCGKAGGFGNHPDAGFGTFSAGDGAADIVTVDRRRGLDGAGRQEKPECGS